MRMLLALPPLLALATSMPAAEPAPIRAWEVFETEARAQSTPANAFVESLPDGQDPFARVTFTGTAGNADKKTVTAGAFWDGESRWKARFAPPLTGDWSYRWTSKDPGLNGKAGALRVSGWAPEETQANPARRGFVRVAGSGRHFEYADGTPFLWIGDTWWNWAKKGIQFSTFQRLADDRARKGFTVGQLFLPGTGGLLDKTGSNPNLDQLRRVEQMIAYANSKGITVWIHPWWSGKRLKDQSPETLRRWWRYVIHRFGAYNVIWVLAGEYNMDDYGGHGLEFWKDLGRMIRREDPYTRVIGAHPTPPGWGGGAAAPQWSTGEAIHAEPWLDYNQSQVGHGKWRNEMIPVVVAADYARRPPKPVVVTEPWYEFIEGNPAGEEVRYGAWAAFLAGAAGHTYGGGHVWWAHVPEAPTNQGAWPLHKEFDTDTLDYPGAVSLSYMAMFLRDIEWWKLEPRPDLVSDYALRLCRAVPGKEYVAFVRWGGALRIDLRLSSSQDRFTFTWHDLTAAKQAASGEVTGGAWREFHSPEDYPKFPQAKDWLLHIRRVN